MLRTFSAFDILGQCAEIFVFTNYKMQLNRPLDLLDGNKIYLVICQCLLRQTIYLAWPARLIYVIYTAYYSGKVGVEPGFKGET